MRRYLLPLWLSVSALVIAACQPVLDPNCKPTEAEKKAWAGAQRAKSADAYRKFLSAYPDSCYAAMATNALRKPVAPVTARRLNDGGGFAPGGADPY
ncbi:hypothetical protein [Gemmobacter caeruleus]|uniref:hypothetical protein n=1 Tax=Gemmobacter caeruleus TaxID=2595004 RepID=UPI0011EE2B0B|nr:hypothetical protein [Gemmobacter caeruleus]